MFLDRMLKELENRNRNTQTKLRILHMLKAIEGMFTTTLENR